jgi:hypothetical protein
MTSASYSQITVKGIVIDEFGEAIPYTSLYLKHDTKVGVTTNQEGKFILSIPDNSFLNNSTILVFSSMGYGRHEEKLIKAKLIELKIELKSFSTVLDDVVLNSESYSSKEYTITKIDKLDIYSNPIANADALKAINLYPYSTNIDETANPSFRGSSPDRTRVVFNGVPIYNPVRNSQINGLGNFSLFNTEIIEKELIYPSNPPLIHGNSSAGLVEIETTKSVDDKIQFSASIAGVGFFINQNISDNFFIQTYANHQFPKLFLNLNRRTFDFLKDFSSSDFGLNSRLSVNDKMYFNFYTYYIKERSENETTILNANDIVNTSNERGFSILNFNTIFNDFKLSINTSYDFSESPFLFKNYNVLTNRKTYFGAFNLTYNGDELLIKGGVNYNHLNYGFRGLSPEFYYALDTDSPTIAINNEIRNKILDAYVYTKYKFNDFIFSLSFRKNIPVNNYINSFKFKNNYFSYQANLKWNINEKNNVIASFGKYHSYSIPNLINQFLELNSTNQFSIDYGFTTKKSQIKISLFKKKDNGRTNDSFENINNSIQQSNITGGELFIESNLSKHLKINLAYTYLNSSIFNDGETFRNFNDLNYIVKSSITFSKKDWTLSLSSILREGANFTPVISSNYIQQLDSFEPVFSSDINSEQYGAYNTVNITLNRYLKFKKNSLILFCSINNIFDRANERNLVYNFDYSNSSKEFLQKRSIYFGGVFSID